MIETIQQGDRLSQMLDHLSLLLAANAYERVKHHIVTLRTGNVESTEADELERLLPSGYQRIKH